MPQWRTRLTSDKSELLAYLDEDRAYAALAIGDLEPRLFAESTFAVPRPTAESGRWLCTSAVSRRRRCSLWATTTGCERS